MKEKLILQEDDQLKEERYQRELPLIKGVLWTTMIATPILTGCMYLLMKDLPKETFPPYFWTRAFLSPLLSLALCVGFGCLVDRFFRRTCFLSAAGVRLGYPQNQFIGWRRLTEWRVEDSRDHPRHFTVEFRGRDSARRIEIILPDTYSKEEIRVFIQYHLARAF